MSFLRHLRGVVKIAMMTGFCAVILGCVPKIALKPVAHPEKTWAQDKKLLEGLRNWSFDGVVGGRFKKKPFNANLEWVQLGDHFELTLSGPLSIGQTVVKGQPGQVTLTDYHGKVYRAHHLNDLLKNKIGWKVPVTQLQSWLKGVPVPNQPAQIKLNEYGLL